MKHTPGPWKAAQPKHDPQAWDVCTESGGVLAKLTWGGEGGANAKLMAAAPELLAACQAAMSKLDHYDGEYKGGPHIKQVRDALRAAMHAATPRLQETQ